MEARGPGALGLVPLSLIYLNMGPTVTSRRSHQFDSKRLLGAGLDSFPPLAQSRDMHPRPWWQQRRRPCSGHISALAEALEQSDRPGVGQ